MILWTFKLVNSVRKAIAGRKHPSQLAWGVALGCLVGLIPHGNLLAVALVIFVLAMKVNHAMVALVGIGITFVAPRMDPMFDGFGRWMFGHPQVAETMSKAWEMPLVPWTDLNNTIVMGSFLTGLIVVVPIFLMAYPLFHRWALTDEDEVQEDTDAVAVDIGSPATKINRHERTDPSHSGFASPHLIPAISNIPVSHASAAKLTGERREGGGSENGRSMFATSGRVYDVRRIDPPQMSELNVGTPGAKPATTAVATTTGEGTIRIASPSAIPAPTSITAAGSPSGPRPPATRPTRVSIGVPKSQSPATRVSPSRTATTAKTSVETTTSATTTATRKTDIEVQSAGSSADDQHKIDEALSYLLRQLRDSKDKDAA